MWTRAELKARAKVAFKRNYVNAVVVAVLMMLVTAVFGGGESRGTRVNINSGSQSGWEESTQDEYYDEELEDSMENLMMDNPVLAGLFTGVALIILVIGICLRVFVGNIFEVGGDGFYVQNQTDRPGIGAILDGFRSGHYGNLVVTMFFRDLFICLWSLLFVIPGIVKSYEYRMIPYILSENPGMDRKEAFQISKQMMNGKKMATFVLDLSFIGWFFLQSLTCGLLGIFYVNPYYMATCSEVYTSNRAIAYQQGVIR